MPALNRHHRRRDKVFGSGSPRPMNTGIKKRIMAMARVKMRATEPGKHYGAITAKHMAVLSALLWGFHNAATGLCFPSYEAIAKAAGCARSTVHEAIQALEAAGILTWVHRLKRIYERVTDMFGDGRPGQRTRVQRTSNGYRFIALIDVKSSKSELRSGTEGQELLSLRLPAPALALKAPRRQLDPENPLEAALLQFGKLVKARSGGG